MMMQRIVFSCLILVSLAAPVLAVPDDPVDFERLSDRVLIVTCGKVYTDQVIAVATERGIVVIDTGAAPSLASRYRKIIEREFGRNDFIYAINTHYHRDHTAGNEVFADAVIISHESTPDKLREFQSGLDGVLESSRAMKARFEERLETADPGSEDASRASDIIYTASIWIEDLKKGLNVTFPTVTFNDRMILDLSDLTLKLVYFGEGRHTGDDIIVHCPEEKLLFTGDLFYRKSMFTAFKPQFDAERWIEALDYVLEDMSRVELVFDTHNGRMKGSFIALWRDYLVELWNGVNQAVEKGDVSLSEIQKQFSYAPHFTYLEKSGLDVEQLRADHEEGLRYIYYRVKQMGSAAALLEEILDEPVGAEALEKRYQEIRAQSADELFYDDVEFNRLGHQLLGQNRIDEAIVIFEINVERHPEAFDTYDSLAEAYVAKGEKDLAIRNYKKSLALNPDNANAAEMLKKLEN